MKTIEDWTGRTGLKLAIATDHGGFEMKRQLIEYLQQKGVDCVDMGPFEYDPDDDYPDFAGKLSFAVASDEVDCGILICRSGVGMGINANRFHNVRAVVAERPIKAEKSREHNCSNILILPGDYIDIEQAKTVLEKWLATPFSFDQRHMRRLLKIETNSYDEIAPIRFEDPEIAAALDKERKRQEECIELIASENFASSAVRAAQASVLTNKYAEGYPGKRYYNGCDFVDEVEALAIKRACDLFGAEAANVQAHSGSQANMAAYFALLEPGDKALAMSLDHGGHLTHGHPMNFSGSLYDIIPYGVNKESEQIDYDEVEKLALLHRPKMIMAGASAYSRIIDFARLRAIADQVSAKLVVDMAHIAGLVAAGEHPSPVPHADIVTSTTHKTLRGPRSGLILCKQEMLKAINSKMFPGIQGGPMMHTIAAKAICFHEAMQPAFKQYQKQVCQNAQTLADALSAKGLRIVSGGTDNHLMLVDLRSKKVTGKELAHHLDRAGITVNKNMIPFDPETPFVTSGIRVGTPAVTTRGMKEAEMTQIANWIDRVLHEWNNDAAYAEIAAEIRTMLQEFPLPGF